MVSGDIQICSTSDNKLLNASSLATKFSLFIHYNNSILAHTVYVYATSYLPT